MIICLYVHRIKLRIKRDNTRDVFQLERINDDKVKKERYTNKTGVIHRDTLGSQSHLDLKEGGAKGRPFVD